MALALRTYQWCQYDWLHPTYALIESCALYLFVQLIHLLLCSQPNLSRRNQRPVTALITVGANSFWDAPLPCLPRLWEANSGNVEAKHCSGEMRPRKRGARFPFLTSSGEFPMASRAKQCSSFHLEFCLCCYESATSCLWGEPPQVLHVNWTYVHKPAIQARRYSARKPSWLEGEWKTPSFAASWEWDRKSDTLSAYSTRCFLVVGLMA